MGPSSDEFYRQELQLFVKEVLRNGPERNWIP